MRLLASSALAPALLAGTLALGACGPVNRGLESVNQPVVHRTDYAIDLGTGGVDGLRSGEAQRLGQWFDSLKLGYGDHVAIDDPGHDGGGTARDAIAALVARYGLLLSEGPPLTSGPIASDDVRVVVSRSHADVPDCPNWKRAADPEFAGSTGSDFGCAINSNLAAMVADPQDLLRGHGESESGTHSDRSIIRAGDAYQRLIPTGVNGDVKNEKTTRGGS